jgi:hypothetical protein
VHGVADLGRGSIAEIADIAETLDLGLVGFGLWQDIPRRDHGTPGRDRQRRQQHQANGKFGKTQGRLSPKGAGIAHIRPDIFLPHVVWVTSFRQDQSDTSIRISFPTRLRAPERSMRINTRMWAERTIGLWC